MDPDNNIKAFLRILIKPFQDLEVMLQQMLTERSINSAIGVQLDQIGEIVGQARGGLDDETYRRYCRARVAANRSKGTAEDQIKVARLVVGDDSATYHMDMIGIAAFVMRVENLALPHVVADVLITFLMASAAGGVRPIVESSAQPPSKWLKFDSGQFDDVNQLMISARDRVLG